MRVSQSQLLGYSQQQKGTAGYIRYPMRVRDFTRFGFIEELFGGESVPPD